MQTHSPEEDPISHAWNTVLQAWEDDEAHRRFVSLCAAMGRLSDAGAKYREVKADPERAPVAERQIDRVLAAAMRSLEPLRSAPPPARTARRIVFLVGLGVFVSLLVVTLWALT